MDNLFKVTSKTTKAEMAKAIDVLEAAVKQSREQYAAVLKAANELGARVPQLEIQLTNCRRFRKRLYYYVGAALFAGILIGAVFQALL